MSTALLWNPISLTFTDEAPVASASPRTTDGRLDGTGWNLNLRPNDLYRFRRNLL
ncbi:MAG: hypothetical protein R2932_28020 [Caldilineaceae bacterium]